MNARQIVKSDNSANPDSFSNVHSAAYERQARQETDLKAIRDAS